MKLSRVWLPLFISSFAMTAMAENNHNSSKTEPNEKNNSQISFSTQVEQSIERDLMQVILYTQVEGKNLAELNKTVTERLNRAISAAKQVTNVEVESHGRNTQIQYNKDGKQIGWINRGEIQLQSKDFAALSELISQIGSDLAIKDMRFSVSPEKIFSIEDELTKKLLTQITHKANSITSSLNAKGYELVELNMNIPSVEGYDNTPIYRAATKASLAAVEIDNLQLEGGKTTLKLWADSKIILLKDN